MVHTTGGMHVSRGRANVTPLTLFTLLLTPLNVTLLPLILATLLPARPADPWPSITRLSHAVSLCPWFLLTSSQRCGGGLVRREAQGCEGGSGCVSMVLTDIIAEVRRGGSSESCSAGCKGGEIKCVCCGDSEYTCWLLHLPTPGDPTQVTRAPPPRCPSSVSSPYTPSPPPPRCPSSTCSPSTCS